MPNSRWNGRATSIARGPDPSRLARRSPRRYAAREMSILVYP
jgi:hypothetical protein